MHKKLEREGKGFHTTTNREIFIYPLSGVVIDTPGIRKIGVETGELEKRCLDSYHKLENKYSYDDLSSKYNKKCKSI